jgi:hypothetical protein
MFEDALAVIFVYPLAVDQMYEHIFCIRDMEETQQQDADFMSDNHDKVVGIVEESRF